MNGFAGSIVQSIDMLTSPIRIQILTGQPIRLGDAQLRVRSQVIQLRLPVVNGVLIWNRPLAVVVRTSADQEQILPVPDLTRSAILILAALSFTSMFLWIFFKRRKIESRKEVNL